MQMNYKSKKSRRKRRKNTKRGRGTNEWRCTTARVKLFVLDCSPSHGPLHLLLLPPHPPIQRLSPPCLRSNPLYLFTLLTTKPHMSCPPPLHLSTLTLHITLCHRPSQPHSPLRPNHNHRAAIPGWLAWSLPHTFTSRPSQTEGPWWPMPTHLSSPVSPRDRDRDLPMSLSHWPSARTHPRYRADLIQLFLSE